MTRPALLPTPDPTPDPTPAPDADADAVRDAVSSFPSGVTVVTTVADGEPYGMTVSAFTSVSQAPPLVLVCVGGTGTGAELLARGGAFCVNVLAAAQAPLARRFASRRRPRGTAMFDGAPYRDGVTGTPVLLGAAAHLECELQATVDGGDHLLVLGRVVAAAAAPHVRPLVVHRRDLTSVEQVSGRPQPSLTVVRP